MPPKQNKAKKTQSQDQEIESDNPKTRTTRSKKEQKQEKVEEKKVQATETESKNEAKKSQRSKKQEEKVLEPIKKVEEKRSTRNKKEKQDEQEKQPIKQVQPKISIPEPVKKVQTEQQEIKKQIVKGGAIVDEFVSGKEKYHVYEGNGKIYDCTMNQTNIRDGNNNNKFYIVQVLETDDNPKQYYVYNRWGRVGVRGQDVFYGCELETALRDYEKKVRDKSVVGDYRILEKDYSPQEDEITKKQKEDAAYDKSQLHPKIKDLIRLIFDMKMINKSMMEIGYDAKKMPLGKLAKSTIDKGFRVLEELSKLLDRKESAKQFIKDDEFAALTSEFYSQIPHDFGFQKAPLIKTQQDIKKKIEMLESIQQIQVATRILDEAQSNDSANLLDQHYAKLLCDIEYVDPQSQLGQMLIKYVQNTHAKTHNNYTLEVQDIYQIKKDSDIRRFKKDIGNRMLLWHGSRITNFVGILSQGLRIAPPEAPVTGYMFGKGVYFADMVSKSANYCGTSKDNPNGLILLCDVALGEFNDKYYADYNAANLPPGKHSTRGVGKTAPSEKSYIDHEGAKVPIGVGELNNGIKYGALLYNEYIVYDVAQVQMKYLIKLKYHYK